MPNLAANDLIVFFGDSITDAGRRDDPQHWGRGYVRLLAEGALSSYQVSNQGISGNRAVDLLERVEEDVVALQPKLVSILIGINDTGRRFSQDDPTSAEDFAATLRQVVEKIAAAGAQLVLMEPFVLPVDDDKRDLWREDLDPKIAVVRELAEEFGAFLVRTDVALTALAAESSPADIAADGVHPTAAGHQAMADLWARTILGASVVQGR